MRKTLLITYILVLALTMQGKNEHPVRSALVSQGDSCMAEHDSQHAIGFYQQHLNTHPGDLPVLRKLASCYRMRGDNKKAIACMDSIPKDSLNHEDMRMLFFTNLNLGNKSAIDNWGLRIRLMYPNDSEVFTTLLSHWNNSNEPENVSAFALSYVEKQDSTNILINKELAYSLFLQFRYKQAIPYYKKLIADGFDNYESNFVLGLCYYNTEKYQLALPYLKRAVDLKDDPTMNSLYFLGMDYKKLADACKADQEAKKEEYRELAIQNLNRSIEVAYPRERALYINQQLAELYYDKGKFGNAGHAFAQCIEYDDSDNPLNYYNAAQMYMADGDELKARLYLRIFLQKAPKMKEGAEKEKLITKAKAQLKTR